MCVPNRLPDVMNDENELTKKGERFHDNFFISFGRWFRHFYSDHPFWLLLHLFFVASTGGVWLIAWPFFDMFMYWLDTADSKELSESRRNEEV